MAITGNWILDAANRSVDTAGAGGLVLIRDNWTVNRSRISDDTYTSALGTIEAGISGYNGGVTETITPPSRTVLSFGTAQNWIATTDIFYEADFSLHQRPVYIMAPTYRAKYNSLMSLVIHTIVQAPGSTTGYWVCAEYAPDTIANRSFPTDDDSADLAYNYVKGSSGGFAVTFSTVGGTYMTPNSHEFKEFIVRNYSGTSAAAVSSSAGKFICTADIQKYENPSVPWYTQVQTWSYLNAWRVL